MNRLCYVIVLVSVLNACDTGPPDPGTAVTQSAHPEQPAPSGQDTAAAADGLDAGMVNPGYQDKPAWFANTFLDLREDIAAAAADGKRVMLYFYQDGCPYCRKLLDTNFSLQDTVQRTRDNFTVIAINMWGDREVTDLAGNSTSEKEFARSMRVMFTPSLLFLDEEGNVVLRINGYYPPHKFNAALEYAAEHDGRDPDFRSYYAGVAPVAASGRLHVEEDFLAADSDLSTRRADRPLLVMFEQKECAPCDELHLDILQRPESRELLSRFDVVLLDLWSTTPVRRPDGRQSTVAEWARELGIQYAPSMVFFDAQNREVFRTEAWLRTFHVQSSLDYVASAAYLEQPYFQRYIAARADALEAQGVHVDLLD